MKKVLKYFIAFLFICFIIPSLLTKSTINTNVNTKETIDNSINEEPIEDNNYVYNYSKYGTIKLLHKSSDEVEEVNVDEYLCNVVAAEMPASFEMEALKAQAVVARTYTVYKVEHKKHDNADICDDSSCCQAWISKEERLNKWEESKREEYWDKILKAVNETKGQIITYENQPINAFFHSNSGGKTEIPVNVWGKSNLPYLQVVETAGEEGYSQYSSEVILTYEELLNNLKEKYNDLQIDFSNNEEIKILEYTDSDRVKTVRFGNHQISGVEARTIFGLKSTNFEIIKGEGTIKFNVKGYRTWCWIEPNWSR